MSDQLLKTACNAWHVANSGRMVDFGGWHMPVQYSTISEEHEAVRNAAGLFDIAHMGRLYCSGPEACRFLDYLLTNDVSRLQVGQIRYSLITDQTGGILDDVLVYRFENLYILVVNASNREKIVHWMSRHQQSFDVAVQDQTLEYFMLALQGPHAAKILNPLVQHDVSELRYYRCIESQVLDAPALVSRTGYTGEDGFEVIVPVEYAEKVWKTLIRGGADQGLLPTGLGCRDTLRLEAAMPLYGHELDESIDPFAAGLAFAVKLDAADFVGKEALLEAKKKETRHKRVGVYLDTRRIARGGAGVFSGDEQIGHVTSGTFSPTFQRSIAMAYVQPQYGGTDGEVEVDIRGKRAKARVVNLPFYRRSN